MSKTLTLQEYNSLVSKSKRGWRMYYLLIEEQMEDAVEMRSRLRDLMDNTEIETMKENVGRLLDGHHLRLQCVICLEDTLNKDNMTLLSCLHRFHKTCLKDYRDHSRDFKCPHCRQ